MSGASALVTLLLVVAAHAVRLPQPTTLTAAASAGEGPTPPRFPGSYTVRYTFSLPYTAKLQPDGIRCPVVFYRDEAAEAVRMDTYNSTTVMIAKKDMLFEVVPRIDRQVCMASHTAGPTVGTNALGAGNLGKQLHLLSALPDVSGWEFAGAGALESGHATRVWQYTARHAAKTTVYRLHTSADGSDTPLRLHMRGNDLFSGSHFDEYVVDYSEFTPGRPDPAVFHRPTLCKGVKPSTALAGGHAAAALRMASSVPSVAYRGMHAEYDAFLSSHGAGRQHTSLAEYRARATLFDANAELVRAHNSRRNASYRLAMNRFGDWSEEEFVALMLPRRARLAARQQPDPSLAGAAGDAEGENAGLHKQRRHEVPHEPLVDPARVPAQLSWRGTGADGIGPKDQATCGSCWAFSATGTMEAAWFKATGQQVSFSEQQIVDCSWGYVPHDPASNLGCDGGNHWAAIGHIVEAGGIALTRDYQYKGQDGYCMANSTGRVGKFKGFARVPRYNDAALREALLSRGPLAISFDASHPSFRFYSGGVYREEQCEYKPSGLDHDILLVGYGSSPEGDYWEVKNSWSDHWGDGGYFKVSVDNNACGVTTDAVYAMVDEAAADL
ncbi:hypothetical protein ABPG77_001597 [Micractinium sp. CCAP 211/92]